MDKKIHLTYRQVNDYFFACFYFPRELPVLTGAAFFFTFFAGIRFEVSETGTSGISISMVITRLDIGEG